MKDILDYTIGEIIALGIGDDINKQTIEKITSIVHLAWANGHAAAIKEKEKFQNVVACPQRLPDWVNSFMPSEQDFIDFVNTKDEPKSIIVDKHGFPYSQRRFTVEMVLVQNPKGIRYTDVYQYIIIDNALNKKIVLEGKNREEEYAFARSKNLEGCYFPYNVQIEKNSKPQNFRIVCKDGVSFINKVN